MGPKSVARSLAAFPAIGIAALSALPGCTTTPERKDFEAVAVCQSPLDGVHPMPAGCREVRRTPPQQWTELDRVSPTDPYRTERAATGAGGGNGLLALDHMTRPRNEFDCPAAAKITDFPPSLGAWFDLVFVSYACSPPGLSELSSGKDRRP